MTSHKEQKKDEYREPKAVMVFGADDALEALALQFRRCEGFDAHLAEKPPTAIDDLKAVAVNEPYGGVLGHENATVIDVADDASSFMDDAKSACGVRRCANKKAPVGAVEIRPTTFRTVEMVNVLAPGDLRHE